MKLGDLVLPLAGLAALGYLVLMQRDTAGDGADAPFLPPVPFSGYGGGGVPLTTIPLVPSEPGVSEGLTLPDNPLVPLCPVMVEGNRYPGDLSLVCQCPSGQIQGGDPSSMNKLMLGMAPEDLAWRSRFCGLG